MKSLLSLKRLITKSLLMPFIFIILCSNTLWADDAYESNDTFANAATLAFGTHSLVGEDDDWFSVSVVPGTLWVQLSHPSMGVPNGIG